MSEDSIDIGTPEGMEIFLKQIKEHGDEAVKKWEDSADEWWQGETFSNITEVLYAHDPAGLAWVAEDEYDPEAREICYRLEEATSIPTLAVIIQEAFDKMLSEELTEEVSLGIAKQMWEHIETGRS